MELAPESRAIERARAKLVGRLGKQSANLDDLERAKESIRAALAHNQQNRKAVPGKVLGLFANNEGAAKESDTVQKIRRLCEQRD